MEKPDPSFKVLFIVTLIILGLVIWKNYWKIQLMYNSTIVSKYTPDTFSVLGNESKYNNTISTGSKIAKTQKVIIISLLRDVEEKIQEIKKKSEEVGRLFEDYRIVIVENDSSDNTRSDLLRWVDQNPKVTILGCGVNVESCKIPKTPKTEGHSVDRARIDKMTKLRNIYMEYIKNELPRTGFTPDYVVIWDLDATGSVYHDGIFHTIGYLSENSDVDVVCAYGIYRWGILTLFYDTYALLYKDEPFHIDMKPIHDLRKGFGESGRSRGDEPVEVDSCFSGFTIYRYDSLLGDDVFYDYSPPDNIECEHTTLHRKIKGKKVFNPSMINFLLENF